MQQNGYDQVLGRVEMVMKMVFGGIKTLYSFNTLQFNDYSKVVADKFNPEEKAKRRKEVFPVDCQKAFEMGARFAKKG